MSNPGRTFARLWIAGCFTVILAFATTAVTTGDTKPTADVDGQAIPLSSVASYHCHDAAFPVISCFRSAAKRDASLSEQRAGNAAAPPLYVTVFAHENYGGSSFSASVSYSHLGILGWNDMITSFKSLNGQHPKFWHDAEYGLPAWQWAVGAWVPNVGPGANDKFSAMRNVP